MLFRTSSKDIKVFILAKILISLSSGKLPKIVSKRSIERDKSEKKMPNEDQKSIANTMDTEGKTQTESLKLLINIPEHCLNKVHTYIDLDDLTEAADDHQPTTSVFSVYFNKKIIKKNIPNDRLTRTFRSFPPIFSKSDYKFTMNTEIFDEATQDYRSSLSELVVYNPISIILDQQFPNLKTLIIHVPRHYNLNKSWKNLNEWFPNLRSFTLKDESGLVILNTSFIHHIPNLKHFHLILPTLCPPNNLLTFGWFLNRNPQILSFSYLLDPSHFKPKETGLTEKFTSIVKWETLSITDLSIYRANMKWVNDGMLKNLRSLTVIRRRNIDEDTQETWACEEYPLEKLCFIGYLTDTMVNFILRCPHLKQFIVRTDSYMNHCHFEQFSLNLNQLEKFSLIMSTKSPYSIEMAMEIIQILFRNCKNLKNVIINYSANHRKLNLHVELYSSFEKKINLEHSKWKMKYTIHELFEGDQFHFCEVILWKEEEEHETITI